MRVALADDSALFRSGLQLLLQAAGVEVTSQASSGDELMANIVPDRPDAVILDLRMPPTFTGEGIETATAIRAWDRASASWCCPPTPRPATRAR